MGHSLGVKAVVIAGVIAVVVIAVALLAYLILVPHASMLEVSAPYAFIINNNGQWVILYYDESGNMHVVGAYANLNDPAVIQAMNVVNQFNQQIVPQHPSYQPLDSIIVVGAGDTGKQGVVEIPVSGNTIELNQVNQGYYTLVAVPQQYTTQLMQALDTGYKLSAIVGSQGANYLQYNDPQVWKLVLETIDLQQYSPLYASFGGGHIIQTNNNTLIPYGFFWASYSYAYGGNLPFIIRASWYNGS